MSRLSQAKEDRIKSNILSILFQHSPEPLFTSQISELEARDEEFVKKLLLDLQKKGLVVMINKNQKGTKYIRRQRWIISSKAYEAYKKHSI